MFVAKQLRNNKSGIALFYWMIESMSKWKIIHLHYSTYMKIKHLELKKYAFAALIAIAILGCKDQKQGTIQKRNKLPDALFTIPVKYNGYGFSKRKEEVELSVSYSDHMKHFSQRYNRTDDCFDLQYMPGYTNTNYLLKIRTYDFERYNYAKAFYICWRYESGFLYDSIIKDSDKSFMNMDTVYTNLDPAALKMFYPEFKGIVIHEKADSITVNRDLFDSVFEILHQEIDVNIHGYQNKIKIDSIRFQKKK